MSAFGFKADIARLYLAVQNCVLQGHTGGPRHDGYAKYGGASCTRCKPARDTEFARSAKVCRDIARRRIGLLERSS